MNAILPDVQPRALEAPMTLEDLSRMLRSGTSPPFSPKELSNYIQNAQHDIKLFEDCIQRLRGRQAALQRDIAQYSSLHSPVRKLPPEILHRIFTFACAADHQNDNPWKYPTFAFHLSSVCSRWRDIALHSPGIWAKISLELAPRFVHPVRLAISRSQQHPLSLQLCGGWDNTQVGQDLFRFLMEHAARWLYVDLAALPWDVIDLLGSISEVPKLEYLLCSTRHVEAILHHLTHYPRLEALKYTFDEMDDPDAIEGISWDAIRRLEIDYDGQETLVSAFEALRLASNVQSFIYLGETVCVTAPHGTRPYSSDDEPSEPLVSKLTTLSAILSAEDGFYAMLHDLLRGLTLPYLTDLTVRFEEPEWGRHKKGFNLQGGWPRDVLYDCLNRSGCTLTTLALEGMSLVEQDIIALLKVVPSVHTFTLSELWASKSDDYSKATPSTLHKTVTRSFLERLEAPGLVDVFSQSPLLPKLRSLRLAVQSHFDADDVFVNVVKSRWDRASGDRTSYATERLRTVVLYVVNRKLVEGIYEPLKQIDEEGMMISVFGDGIRVV